MLCATIVAVFFTSFVQGMTVKPIVEWLKVKKQENKEKTVSQEFVGSYIDHMLTGIEVGCSWFIGVFSLIDPYFLIIIRFFVQHKFLQKLFWELFWQVFTSNKIISPGHPEVKT